MYVRDVLPTWIVCVVSPATAVRPVQPIVAPPAPPVEVPPSPPFPAEPPPPRPPAPARPPAPPLPTAAPPGPEPPTPPVAFVPPVPPPVPTPAPPTPPVATPVPAAPPVDPPVPGPEPAPPPSPPVPVGAPPLELQLGANAAAATSRVMKKNRGAAGADAGAFIAASSGEVAIIPGNAAAAIGESAYRHRRRFDGPGFVDDGVFDADRAHLRPPREHRRPPRRPRAHRPVARGSNRLPRRRRDPGSIARSGARGPFGARMRLHSRKPRRLPARPGADSPVHGDARHHRGGRRLSGRPELRRAGLRADLPAHAGPRDGRRD